MATGNVARTLRGPGRLVIDPVVNFATGTFPYGGTTIGHAKLVRLLPLGQPFRVWYEILGAYGDVLEGDLRCTLSLFLRGWDDDAVERLMSNGYERGPASQHSTFAFPGEQTPGKSALGRAVRIAYIPDDIERVPGLVVFRAVPSFDPGAELSWQRNAELGIPLTFECLPEEETGAVYRVGRLHDIDLGGV